jgi:hypothetical protein
MEDWNKSSGGKRRTKNACSLSLCSSSAIQCNLNLSNLMLYSIYFAFLLTYCSVCVYIHVYVLYTDVYM